VAELVIHVRQHQFGNRQQFVIAIVWKIDVMGSD
jgi:hypothetical protein